MVHQSSYQVQSNAPSWQYRWHQYICIYVHCLVGISQQPRDSYAFLNQACGPAVGVCLVYWNCFPKSVCVCLFVCMLVFPHPPVQSFRSQKQHVHEKWRLYRACINWLAGEYWFEVGSTCQSEVRVEWVWKDIVRAFTKGLYGRKTAGK